MDEVEHAIDLIGDLHDKNITTGVATKRHRLGTILVATNVGGTLSYLSGDYLHSTVSASNGATVEYTPFGLVRTSSGTLPTDRQFQGQQHEAGVGLYKMGARWYDPAIGLWTQPDTLCHTEWKQTCFNPVQLNAYAYVHDNPLKYVDRTGKGPEVIPLIAACIGSIWCMAAVGVVGLGAIFIASTQPVHVDPVVFPDTGGQTASPPAPPAPTPGSGQDFEDKVRALLSQAHDQPYGESDTEIGRNLGIKGPRSDFVGLNRATAEWDIAEMKGSGLGKAFGQLKNTYNAWRASNPNARLSSLRIYTTEYERFAAGGHDEGNYVRNGFLGYYNEDGEWIYSTIDGELVQVLPGP